jgi:hypothetical protein
MTDTKRFIMKKVIENMNKTKTIELANALFTIGTAS